MSDPRHPLTPPPDEVAQLVRLEREWPDPPGQMADEIFARLRGTLGLPGGDGGDGGQGGDDGQGGDGSGGSTPPDGSSAPHGSGVSPPAGAGQVAAGAGQALATSAPLLRTVVAFVLGSGVGAGVHQAFDVRAQRQAAVAALTAGPASPAFAPPPVEAPVLTPPPAPAPVAPVAPVVVRALTRTEPLKVPRGPQAEIRERDRDLAAERALLEQARTALARGNGEAALAALERHARAFAHGALEEERESLRVQALVESDQPEQARNAGARFARRFPRSIFAPVVDEALKSIP